MASILSFDELNVLDHKNRRSEDYEDYFSGMGLTRQQKKDRISLAERFEEEFWPVLVYLFGLLPFGLLQEDEAKELFLLAFLTAVADSLQPDEYLRNYAEEFSAEVARSTVENSEDPYYFSIDRAMYLSENESESAWNHDDYEKAILAGKKYKEWIDMRDKRVRPTHREVHGTVKLIQEPFLVGDSLLLYPKDTSLGADPSEIVNCRCIVKYS